MANPYSDELLKKKDPQNYEMIQQAKNAYTMAQQNNDQTGMTNANNQANAVRSAYGYSSADGTNFAPTQQTSSWGNAYQQILGMNRQTENAYQNKVNAQTDTNVYNIGRNKQDVNNRYNQSTEALNQSQRQQTSALPEQLAKMGLYGSGTGETALSNITNAYAQQLSALNNQRNQSLYDIDTQIQQAKQQGVQQLADYSFQMAMQEPQTYLQMLQSQQEEDRYNNQAAYGRLRDTLGDQERADRYKVEDGNTDRAFELQEREIINSIVLNWAQFNENNEQFWADFKRQNNISDRDFNEMVRQFNQTMGYNYASLNQKKNNAGGGKFSPIDEIPIDEIPTTIEDRARELLSAGVKGIGQKNSAEYIMSSNLTEEQKDYLLTELEIPAGVLGRVIGG